MRRMLCNRTAVVCLAFAAMCLVRPGTVMGDAAPLQAAGRTLVPKGQTNVRMLSEMVTIDVSYDPRGSVTNGAFGLSASPYCGHIRALFEFEALAPEQLLVGFPLGLLLGNGLFAGPVSDFRCSVDGRAVTHEVNEVRQDDGPSEVWATWKVAFPEGKIQIDVDYRVPFEVYWPSEDLSCWYVLNTGRYWAGDIGRAVISLGIYGHDGGMVPLRPEDIMEQTTKGWRIDSGRVVWEFRDIEQDATRTAYFIARFLLSPDYETWARLGMRRQDIDLLYLLGFAQCKQALPASDDDGLHVAYLHLLQTWPGTDQDPGLLQDYLAGQVWSWTVWHGVRVPDEMERPFICKKAVRLCAFQGKKAIPGVVNALQQLSIGVEEVGQEESWTKDFSGLSADRLMKAQAALCSALSSAATGGVPELPRAKDRACLPVLLAFGVVAAICAAVVLARARSSPAHPDGGDLPGEGSHP